MVQVESSSTPSRGKKHVISIKSSSEWVAEGTEDRMLPSQFGSKERLLKKNRLRNKKPNFEDEDFGTNWLGILGQVALPLWASVSYPVKEGT